MDQHVQSLLNQNTAQQQREKCNLRTVSQQYGGKPVGQSQIYRTQQEQQLGTLNQFELGRIHSIQNVLNTERDRLKDENHEIQKWKEKVSVLDTQDSGIYDGICKLRARNESCSGTKAQHLGGRQHVCKYRERMLENQRKWRIERKRLNDVIAELTSVLEQMTQMHKQEMQNAAPELKRYGQYYSSRSVSK